ncbi:hypothetical protein V6Z11_D03G133000 [Gossypium hirsutum]
MIASFALFVDSGRKGKFRPSSTVDSGATDHMTGIPNLFSTFQSQNSPPVTIVNVSTYKVVDFGSINLTSFITLSLVLNSPNLAFNLISISELTRDLNCTISFFSQSLPFTGSCDEAQYW